MKDIWQLTNIWDEEKNYSLSKLLLSAELLICLFKIINRLVTTEIDLLIWGLCSRKGGNSNIYNFEKIDFENLIMCKQIKTKIEYPYRDTKNRFADNYQKFDRIFS